MNTFKNKSMPSWMDMNMIASKHWMKSEDVDAELSMEQLLDEIDENEAIALNSSCRDDSSWFRSDASYSACNTSSFKYPDMKLRHIACDYEAYKISEYGIYPLSSDGPGLKMCNMTSQQTKQTFPEYEKCFKPGGMENLDCQKACYTYPDQPGCEDIKAIVDTMTDEERQKKIGEITAAEQAAQNPPPEEMVVVAASMRSVTPRAVTFSFVDPNTKKKVIAKKTLLDLYKPNDKVSVVLARGTNEVMGFGQKFNVADPTPKPPTPKPPTPKPPTPKPPTPVGNIIVKGMVLKIISPDQVQIQYVKPDKKLVIMKTIKKAHKMKLNEIIKVNLSKTAPNAFISIAKK